MAGLLFFLLSLCQHIANQPGVAYLSTAVLNGVVYLACHGNQRPLWPPDGLLIGAGSTDPSFSDVTAAVVSEWSTKLHLRKSTGSRLQVPRSPPTGSALNMMHGNFWD